MIHTLQNLVLRVPTDSARELYLRAGGEVREREQSLLLSSATSQAACFSFDTYFNAFSLSVWRRHAGLDTVRLTVDLAGSGTLSLVGVDEDNRETVLVQRTFASSQRQRITLTPPLTRHILMFLRITTSHCRLWQGQWQTWRQAGQIRQVVLSIGICTWKREAFVTRTVARLSAFMATHRELDGHIFIHIADNGRTLTPRMFPQSNVFLHPNSNAGGAGGFARCMLETLDQTPAATHLLLMDDDIELEAESVFRTLRLLELLTPDGHERTVVAGAMLNTQRRHLQEIREEAFTPATARLRQLRPAVDLRQRAALVDNDGPHPSHRHQYAAWWYCAFPCAFLRERGLAFPFFFQGDDVEFSLRNHVTPLYLNGIAVWHELFFTKRQSFRTYYLVRNRLIMLSLLGSGQLPRLRALCLSVGKEACACNYTAIDYALAGIDAFLQGPEALPRRQPWTTRPSFPEWGTFTPMTQAPDDLLLQPHPASRARLILAALTLNGHLLPQALLGDAPVVRGKFLDYAGNILFKRGIRIFDGSQLHERPLSRTELLKRLWPFLRCVFRILIHGKRAARAWRRVQRSLTSPAFWRQALDT